MVILEKVIAKTPLSEARAFRRSVGALMFLLRRIPAGGTKVPAIKKEVNARVNLEDAARHAAAIRIQTIWRGRDFRQLLFWLFSQVDVGYEIRLSTHRIRQRSLFYGLCKRLVFFVSMLTVVFMHQGASVRHGGSNAYGPTLSQGPTLWLATPLRAGVGKP